MKTCVIFNPAAKGRKADRLRRRLDDISRHAVLKQTAAAGDARRLAAEAIAKGCDTPPGADPWPFTDNLFVTISARMW